MPVRDVRLVLCDFYRVVAIIGSCNYIDQIPACSRLTELFYDKHRVAGRMEDRALDYYRDELYELIINKMNTL